MKRLLILSCSSRKDDTPEDLPALERYTGLMWDALRKAFQSHPSTIDNLDVWVLSANYGLVALEHVAADYDFVMTLERASELRQPTLESYSKLVLSGKYSEVCFALGQMYMLAFAGHEDITPDGVAVTYLKGTLGVKPKQLYQWLTGKELRKKEPREKKGPRQLQLDGEPLNLTYEEVLEAGRKGIRERDARAQRYRDWYVVIDENFFVAPKWLLAVAAGKNANTFDTAKAVKVLQRLGFECQRISNPLVEG